MQEVWKVCMKLYTEYIFYGLIIGCDIFSPPQVFTLFLLGCIAMFPQTPTRHITDMFSNHSSRSHIMNIIPSWEICPPEHYAFTISITFHRHRTSAFFSFCVAVGLVTTITIVICGFNKRKWACGSRSIACYSFSWICLSICLNFPL